MTEATTSVLLRAAPDGGGTDWLKWLAFSHESISDTLHKVCPRPSRCFERAKTDTGLQKVLPTTLTISLFLALILPLSLQALAHPPFL